MRKALLWLGPMLMMLACATLMGITPTAMNPVRPSPSELPSTTPTQPPSQTPVIAPASPATPSASAIEALIRSLTATAFYASPYPTLTVAPAWDCKLNWQSPADGITYEPETSFTTGWKVTNTGTSPWDTSSVQFVYRAGAKLGAETVVPLRTSVAPGAFVVLSVAMTAPREAVMYTTRWSLRAGNTYFCSVSLSFYVSTE